MGNQYIKISADKNEYADISDSGTWFKRNNRLFVPIGTTGEDEVISIAFGGENQQAGNILVEGSLSQGRSGLINTMIISTLINYDPNSVIVYYLSYSGIDTEEFAAPYHSILVNNRFSEFVIRIRTELEARISLMESSSSQELKQCNKKMPICLPQIMVFIDCVERIFSTYTIGEEFMTLLAHGKSYGVHFILASKNLCMIDIDAIIDHFDSILFFDRHSRGFCYVQDLKDDSADMMRFCISPLDDDLMDSTIKKILYASK